jgi:hypothetical protein
VDLSDFSLIHNRLKARNVLILAAIAGLAFVIRILPLLHPGVAWAWSPDSIGYVRLANGLLSGCGFGQRSGTACIAEVQRTPGYPLFVAALPSLRMVLVVQSVLGTVVCFLLALFAWSRWGLAAGLLTELIAGFDLGSVMACNSVLTEGLFTSIVTLAILLQLVTICRGTLDVWTIGAILGVGFLIAISMLVRPIGQVLLPVPLLGIIPLNNVSLKKKTILSLLVVSIPIATILGWSYRNYQQRGLWTFSTGGALVLYYSRAVNVLAYETGRDANDIVDDVVRQEGRENGAPDLWSKTFDQDPREMYNKAFPILLRHPSTAALLACEGLLRICLSPPNRIGLSAFLGHFVGKAEASALVSRNILSSIRTTFAYPWLVVVRSLLVYQFALNTFTFIGVGLALRRVWESLLSNVWLIVIPLVAALLMIAPAAGLGEQDRYREPAVPMLAVVAAFGWTAKPRRAILTETYSRHATA